MDYYPHSAPASPSQPRRSVPSQGSLPPSPIPPRALYPQASAETLRPDVALHSAHSAPGSPTPSRPRAHIHYAVPSPVGSAAVPPSTPTASQRDLVGRIATVRRKVPLQTGNFVVDFPVAPKYLDECEEKKDNEFLRLRYTAVTCDPDDFAKPEFGYDLRPRLLRRDTELFIVMTMYNEDEQLFAKTMSSVQKNIAFMCSEGCPVSWGPDGWKNVVVCIVSDGRTKVNKRVLTMLQAMGVYAPGLERVQVDGKQVTAHLYEFTTQISFDENLEIRTHRNGIVPVQVLFCLKEKNAKKINSHRWFFNAFGPMLKPNVCVLLDVGTKPTSTSIFHLWRAFDADSQVGGACGEIAVDLGAGCSNLLNPLVAAQNFEYKMSNILDKPLESVFGYIQVLPGAFSAYRYSALQNSSITTGPLASYFKGEKHNDQASVSEANMYLAEDRILCFELVTKRNENWLLKYVKNAKAETDAPSTLPELVSQRRRWLNGSTFAAVHAVLNFSAFWQSSHSFPRKLVFLFQEMYNCYNLLFSWFAIGNFYLTFHLLFQGTQNPETDPFGGAGPTIFTVLQYLYFAALATLFIISFGNRPQASKVLYYSILVLFAIVMGFLLFMGGHTVYEGVPKTSQEWAEIGDLIIREPAFRDIIVSLGSTYGLYILSSVMHADPWHVLTSMVQYMFLLPAYVNIFNVYAFCNLHDISWGTKGDNVSQTVTIANAAVRNESKDEVTVELPKDDQASLNAMYEGSMRTLFNRPEKTKAGRDRQTKLDDYFRLYRTRVVLLWLLSNAALIIVFTTSAITEKIQAADNPVHPYLSFIFWSVAALSAVRFVGSTIYVVAWLLEAMGYVVFSRKFVPQSERNRKMQAKRSER
ncbi:chitin synthase-domain-containing protein [Gaertneriomyces semiglobifer]|nr:chitin synthase-domain-containing protein [Gaertneriomyces semiglobifer]